ncbi:MAG: CinA family protein, partial [Corynebacterium sp.]|nr:CinA family protein [Corynebacterium sp.]
MPEAGGSALPGILARRLVTAATSAGFTVATAESLTAGAIASTVADIPGASAVLRGGLVVYATDLKASLAGVDEELLDARGPVDPDVARQLARGAATRCGADIGLGVTGVAGP